VKIAVNSPPTLRKIKFYLSPVTNLAKMKSAGLVSIPENITPKKYKTRVIYIRVILTRNIFLLPRTKAINPKIRLPTIPPI
jgi:hypothetical protein